MKEDMIAQTTLDQMVSSDKIQMLKATVPYLPAKGQQALSLYTKLLELTNTLHLFSPENSSVQMCAASFGTPLDMVNDIRQFCYGKSRQQLDQLVNAFVMLEMMQTMQQNPHSKGGPFDE